MPPFSVPITRLATRARARSAVFRLSSFRGFLLCLPALLASVALGGAGCAKRETAVEAGYRTQTLHFGNASEPPDLDPHTNISAAAGYIIGALFESLVWVANDGTTVLPGVAERWEISADGRTFLFHLRRDARWSNGDPLTADDIVAGYRRFLDPALACEAANVVFPITGARDYLEGRSKDFATVGVKALDSSTVRITTRFRAPYLIQVVGGIVPVHQPSLDRFDGRTKRGGKWTQPGHLISNGPFVLKQWKPNVVVAVARNPHYWNASRVQLQEIRFHPIEDLSAEERAFRSGQLHVTSSLPFNKVAPYRQRRAPELQLAPVLRSNYISFQTQKPPFSDARVRRAFSLAIDREQLAASVLNGLGDPAYTYVRPGTGGYHVGKQARFDPAEARRLLAEAGFPRGAGFPPVDYLLNGRNEDTLTIAQALQRMWQENLGVKVQLAPTEFKVWLDLLRTRSFHITADNWNLGFADPVDLLALGVTGDPNNVAIWSHAPYDVAFAAIESAPYDDARRRAIETCERLIGEEVPYAPVWYTNRARLVHPMVQGWRNNALQFIDWTALSLQAP